MALKEKPGFICEFVHPGAWIADPLGGKQLVDLLDQ